MPKRTNLFQEVVAIIYDHMAGDAVVEESAEFPDPVTGQPREVDVVIRSEVAGVEVIVSIEAVERSRKADTTWVKSMLEKHRALPTSKLVLVAEKGFWNTARRKAEAGHAVPLSPEDVGTGDPVRAVMNALPSLWPKTLLLRPDAAVISATRPEGELVRVTDVPPDMLLFRETGEQIATIAFAFQSLIGGNFLDIQDQIGLRDIAEDLDRFFAFSTGPPFVVQIDGKTEHVYIRQEQTSPPELHQIQEIWFKGTANIRVTEMPLEHRRLGDISYAYGEGKLGDQPILFVATESDAGPKATIRLKQHRDDGTAYVADNKLNPSAHWLSQTIEAFQR